VQRVWLVEGLSCGFSLSGCSPAFGRPQGTASKNGGLQVFASDSTEFVRGHAAPMCMLDGARQLVVDGFLNREAPIGWHMLESIGPDILQPTADLLSRARRTPKMGNGSGESRLGTEYEYCAREWVHGAGV